MSRRRSRLARWSALLLAYLVVPLAALATLEVCLRLGGALRPTTFFVAAPDRPGSEDAVATNPLFGYTWFPASYAIRPAPRRVARAPGDETLRVAVVGGSAAFGDLAPRFGLSRVLEVVLAGATDRPVEVVNAALAGVNSHVVRRIVDDVLDLRPDAVVIYLGHNEVVGPWGPGAVAERGDPDDRPPPLATIRRVEALRTLRLAQALGRLSPRVGAPDAASARPAADEIAALEVPLGDPRLERVEAHLEANLRAMVRAVRRAGAIALVVAPASNLRDFAPFASTVPDGAAGEAVRRGLEAMFDAAEAGDCDRLFALADELGAAGAETADAVWLRGRCLLRDGELEAARDALRRARDLDAQRYRADSRLRAAILEIADDEGARVLDGAELLADADGLAGADSFYDHVHLTFEGNRRLAVGIAQRLASEAAAASGFEAERLDPERLDPSPADLQRALALDLETARRLARRVEARGEQPMFRARLASRRGLAGPPAPFARTAVAGERLKVVRRAVADRPDDVALRAALAEALADAGQPSGAVVRWQELLAEQPRQTGWRVELALTELARGRVEAALEQLETATEDDAFDPRSRVALGDLLRREGRLDGAETAYRAALALDAASPRARRGLVDVLRRSGREEEASALLPAAAERP